MCRVFKFEVLESLETLETLLKQEKDVRKRERLQFLYWYKTGQAKTRQALGKLVNRSQFCHRTMDRHLPYRGLKRFTQSQLSRRQLSSLYTDRSPMAIKRKTCSPRGLPVIKHPSLAQTNTWFGGTLFNRFGTVKYRLEAHLKCRDRTRLITI